MNEVRKTYGESVGRYVSPAISVVLFQPEGVLCTSGDNEGFGPGGDYEIE